GVTYAEQDDRINDPISNGITNSDSLPDVSILCARHAVLDIETGYVEKTIGQTSALPGAANTITVTLEVNQELP
ncbi:MAG: hypothetical protein ACPIOQ_48330, partial [Promethearchaeia archaeon]